MNRYNIFNRLIIELRLKNSRFIVCVPNVSNLKTSKFQIATASVVADESEGRSGREQIPASGEAALITQPGTSKRSELQCTAIVCHPSPDWGGGRGCRGPRQVAPGCLDGRRSFLLPLSSLQLGWEERPAADSQSYTEGG